MLNIHSYTLMVTNNCSNKTRCADTVYTYAYIATYTYAHVHTCAYAHTYADTYAHMHACTYTQRGIAS